MAIFFWSYVGLPCSSANPCFVCCYVRTYFCQKQLSNKLHDIKTKVFQFTRLHYIFLFRKQISKQGLWKNNVIKRHLGLSGALVFENKRRQLRYLKMKTDSDFIHTKCSLWDSPYVEAICTIFLPLFRLYNERQKFKNWDCRWFTSRLLSLHVKKSNCRIADICTSLFKDNCLSETQLVTSYSLLMGMHPIVWSTGWLNYSSLFANSSHTMFLGKEIPYHNLTAFCHNLGDNLQLKQMILMV